MKTHRAKTYVRLAAVIATAAAIVVSVYIASGGSGASSADPFVGKTPAQVLAISSTAGLAKGSVHVVEVHSFNGRPGRIVSDAGGVQGKQITTGSFTGNATILVVSRQMLYVQGNAAFLEGIMTRQDTAQYAGKWISVPSSSTYYAGISTFLTVSSVMAGISPSPPLAFAKPRTLSGKRVIGVSGGPGPYEPSGSTGKWVLYISTARPYLPVELVGRESFSGGTLSFTDTLSRYGARVVVRAPAHSISLSSIGTSST